MHDTTNSDSIGEIAVVGMAGKFPRAKNIDEFWQNIRKGVEAITFFSEEELRAEGLDSTILDDPNFVPAGGVLDGMDLFDASFFGFTPREAEAMDPQHRLLLECAWETMENAGYNSETFDGPIGVFCGTSMSSYMFVNLVSNRPLVTSLGGFQLALSNDKDYSATNISFKLNLKGPSINAQSACSTSLVTMALGCQGLLNYECDMALAGGASIGLLKRVGYMYRPGNIESPDGHCRAFDAKAGGTVHGDGVGFVLLKRLADAVEAGDYIHAVIRAAAVNNDGSEKIGYTAPGVDGQAEVIAMAQSMAGIEPESIDYIETHGTGTELGDPIEVEALSKAFRARTEKKGFCGIGSVKTNIGHLFAAAGVAGFIKTVMALENEEMPPSLHFEKPNPKIDFENSPFYVNTKLKPWPRNRRPRRAAVSSFGIGGTNAHVLIEEAPLRQPSGDSRGEQLLLLSARTVTALDQMTNNLADYLKTHGDVNLADVAYTLQVGRKSFKHRKAIVCGDIDDAQKLLQTPTPKRAVTAACTAENRPVVFMFPGQGAQYANMGKGLYETEAVYREAVDKCCAVLASHMDESLIDVLFPAADAVETANEKLKQTAITQPALFVVEYALAKLWMSWGVLPQALIGHSIGEYVAACLAGVFSVEDALALVAARGRLMQQLPGGSMLAVPSPQAQVRSMLDGSLSIAAVNGPSLCAVSGPTPEIDQLERRLAENGIECRRLLTSHAFHSSMMDDILDPFEALVAKVERSSANIPYISNVSGTWITPEQIADPKYWSQHLRNAVLFADGIQELFKEPSRLFLEVGPGRTLGTLTGMTLFDLKKGQPQQAAGEAIASSMRHPDDKQPDLSHLLLALGKLWTSGVNINWPDFYQKERRQRLPLPGYHFERSRYWIEPNIDWLSGASAGPDSIRALPKKPDAADWFYVPSWKRTATRMSLAPANETLEELCWLVFLDDCGVGDQIVSHLEQTNQHVVTVRAGAKFAESSENRFVIDPRNQADYESLLKKVKEQDRTPNRVLHLWSLKSLSAVEFGLDNLDDTMAHGFYSLLFLAQALGNHVNHDLKLLTVINGGLNIYGDDLQSPEKAILLGPGRVIGIEYPNIDSGTLDIVLPDEGETTEFKCLVEQIVNEANPENKEAVVAYRRHHRWVQDWDAVKLQEADQTPKRLRDGGVYLITGGLGGIGLVFAEYLAKTVNAKLILTGRSALPAREEWESYIKNADNNDPAREKIRKVKELEAAGAEVFVASADVANFEQMQKVISESTARFGPINGIIHAAGVPGSTITQLLTPEMAAKVLDPKIKGTLVLQALCKDIDLDIFVLCSSIASVFGFAGQFDYGAANDFLDAFANYQNSRSNTHTVAINWDSWADVGMSVSTDPADMTDERKRDLEVAIKPAEGVDALCRTLNTNLGQVVVVTRDLHKQFEFLFPTEGQGSENGEAGTEDSQSGQTKYSRPVMSNEYVAPSDDVQQSLADIWQDIFGIDNVGIHDDFYELGGHSLLAARLTARVRERFNIDLALQTFFEKQTISELSDIILEKLVEQEGSETISGILSEIEQQS